MVRNFLEHILYNLAVLTDITYTELTNRNLRIFFASFLYIFALNFFVSCEILYLYYRPLEFYNLVFFL
jgi:hypothetical protein